MPHLVNNSGKVRDWQKYQHLWTGRCPPQVTSRARGSLGRSLMGGGELRKDWNRMQMSGTRSDFAGVALYFIYALIFK